MNLLTTMQDLTKNTTIAMDPIGVTQMNNLLFRH